MQLLSTLGALALLSGSAFAAVPQLLERDDSGWAWPWAGKKHNQDAYPAVASSPSSVDPATSLTALAVHHGHTVSSLAIGFPTATGIWGTGTAYRPSSSSSAFTCPSITASTSYITVTASVTSTTVLVFTGRADHVPTSKFPTRASANSTGVYTYSSWNTSRSIWGTGTRDPIRPSLGAHYTNISSDAATSTFSSSSPASMSILTNTFAMSRPCVNTTSPVSNVTSTLYSNTARPTSTITSSFNSNTATPAATSTPCDDDMTGILSTITTKLYSNTTYQPASTHTNTHYTNTTITSIKTRTRTHKPFSQSSSSISLPSSIPLPISINTGTDLHPSTTFAPTTTITSSLATGTPNPKAVHCGLHGLPVGDYFLAEFVENKNDEAVTLEGCYQFCAGAYGINMGCESYQFYPEEGTGAPRCDLYGGSVAQSLDSINNYVPNVWYDLGCGDPLSS